jgi:hypothetical protein
MGHLNRREQGVALPVMLIMLVVMLVSSIYLLKSSNSSTIGAANLSYEDSLAKAADLGLQAGFDYLQARSKVSKSLLTGDDLANGYVSLYDPTQQVSDPLFWQSKKIIPAGPGVPFQVQYVIHRACIYTGRYDLANNTCMQTSANPLQAGSPVALGASFAINSSTYTSAPQLHYIITARILGPRGGNVVSQLVVLIDA